MTQIKIFGTILVLALIAVGIGWLTTRKSPSPGPINQTSFVADGNLLKDNPGFKPGVWYLSYEQAGSPALSTELNLADQSQDLQVGMRVHVEGTKSGDTTTVSKLTILNANKQNLIWLDTPQPNQTIVNPITLHGYAKSSWYFEAVFPIKVFDANGKLLGQAQGQAQGDWMTGGYVEFMASLNFTKSTTATGTLVLEKDNPSGLPQNADKLEIPIQFGTEGRAVKLYYYNPNKDKDSSGNILCSRQGLVAVDRQIPITITPIQDTIKLLLQGNLSAAEKAQGLTTEYPLPGFELKGANLAGNKLTLEFADPQNKTVGGSCRVGILWFQIEATAKQFPGVAQVIFKPAELFQP